MPSSKVDICNAALGKLGQDIMLSAMTENTKHARAFNRVFDRVRDFVLTDFVWPFATKSVALALDAQESPGWAYRYAYPSDCLNALAVCGEDGVRIALASAASGCWDARPTRAIDGRHEFTVLHGTQSTAIATDLADAYLIYTCRVEEVARFAPHFVEALACRLAIEVAPVIAAEVGLKIGDRLEQKYLAAKSAAAVHALNEAHETTTIETPSMAARR